MKCRGKSSVTHLVGLSELESNLIDFEVGLEEKVTSLKGPAILRMQLVSDCLSLEMMIVRGESRVS
jgi:hypothetical protein